MWKICFLIFLGNFVIFCLKVILRLFLFLSFFRRIWIFFIKFFCFSLIGCKCRSKIFKFFWVVFKIVVIFCNWICIFFLFNFKVCWLIFDKIMWAVNNFWLIVLCKFWVICFFFFLMIFFFWVRLWFLVFWSVFVKRLSLLDKDLKLVFKFGFVIWIIFCFVNKCLRLVCIFFRESFLIFC